MGQPHCPAEQACAAGHFLSQAPQELPVVCKSTHESPQRTSVPGQGWLLGMHTSTAQISPTLQVLSQLPQWAGVLRLLHSVPHSCSPTGHWQLPSTQAAPPAHAVSQVPQWAESDIGSKHWPWQNSTPSGQPHTPP